MSQILHMPLWFPVLSKFLKLLFKTTPLSTDYFEFEESCFSIASYHDVKDSFETSMKTELSLSKLKLYLCSVKTPFTEPVLYQAAQNSW